MPSYQIIQTNQACTVRFEFVFKQPDGTTAIDLTGASGIFVLKRELSATDAEAVYSTESITIPVGTDGKAYVTVPAADLRKLAVTVSWDLCAQLRLELKP